MRKRRTHDRRIGPTASPPRPHGVLRRARPEPYTLAAGKRLEVLARSQVYCRSATKCVVVGCLILCVGCHSLLGKQHFGSISGRRRRPAASSGRATERSSCERKHCLSLHPLSLCPRNKDDPRGRTPCVYQKRKQLPTRLAAERRPSRVHPGVWSPRPHSPRRTPANSPRLRRWQRRRCPNGSPRGRPSAQQPRPQASRTSGCHSRYGRRCRHPPPSESHWLPHTTTVSRPPSRRSRRRHRPGKPPDRPPPRRRWRRPPCSHRRRDMQTPRACAVACGRWTERALGRRRPQRLRRRCLACRAPRPVGRSCALAPRACTRSSDGWC